MAFSLIVPEISGNPKKAKDVIISVLIHKWPLSIKEIYNQTKKYHSCSFSYQAVYKSLNDLLDKKVLIKKGTKYEIDIGWIKKVQSFTDIVETNYFANQELNSLSGLKNANPNQDIMILNFKTVFDAEKYLYYFMKTELFNKKSKTITYQTTHEWKPIFYFRAEYNYYTRLKKRNHKIYFLTQGNSKIEKEIKQFYSKIGVKFKTAKTPPLNDTISFSDYLVQIFIPEKIKNKIAHHLEKGNFMELREILSKKSSIKMIINKDSYMAKEMQNRIIKKFNPKVQHYPNPQEQ